MGFIEDDRGSAGAEGLSREAAELFWRKLRGLGYWPEDGFVNVLEADLYNVLMLALKAAQADAERRRDEAWWDALAGVPGVGPTPEDVKRWVLQMNSEAERQAFEEAAAIANAEAQSNALARDRADAECGSDAALAAWDAALSAWRSGRQG